jgi:acetylornithine deacetylase/succinyl-diaminopimelate desuccinylase-like protein
VLTENGGIHSGPDDAPYIGVNVGERGVAWRRLTVRGTPGHGSMPFRKDNALVTAAQVVARLADYRPDPVVTELWRERVDTMNLPDDVRAALLDPSRIDAVLDGLPSVPAAAHLHACTHTTFSPNLIGGDDMKVNVIPDRVVIELDVRTLPGEGPDEVDAHLRAALGDLYERVDVDELMNDRASISRTDNPLWDALGRAVNIPFPTARLSPQLSVGFTDARVFRELGSIAYGAGLFSPALDAADFGARFHGHDERIDVDSLALTARLWHHVITDLLG